MLACCAFAGFAADTKQKRQPIQPTDIIHSTVETITTLYGAVYEYAEGKANEFGIPAKVKSTMSNVLTEDPVGFACSKIGCKKDEVDGHISNAQSVIRQAKANAHEQASKFNEMLDGMADAAVHKFEQFVPSYKGALARKFWDLVLFVVYAVFVFCLVAWMTWFLLSLACSIFCCVVCCRCCRRKGSADAKNAKNGKKGGADAKSKAAPKAASPKKK